ncbi:MAG: glucose 1-dehydrogenase [Chrysiogenales bacterium]|nr:MAG: glucose 1-dehydrogenase [Chrysiogenales bacterium]
MKLQEMFDLTGKVAIVTGGGRGIGKFIATGLAEAGANLVIASRKIENCEKTAAELAGLGVKTLAVKLDVSVEENIRNLLDRVMKEFGKIDILVNNAGLTWGAPTLDFPLEQWDRIFNVNIRGAWMISQMTAALMKESGGGKMINISSIHGERGSLEEAHPAVAYNSTKAALNILTMNLAVKLARHNIYVNAIAPGFFKTDMMKYLFKPEMKPILDAFIGYIPLKRHGDEDDIKGLAVFLASRASDYMTGAVIPCDGGIMAKQ